MASILKNTSAIAFTNKHAANLVKWNVVRGSRISIGSTLFSYQLGTKLLSEFKSDIAGTVIKILKENGQMLNTGDHVLILKHCLHPIVNESLCVACGLDLAHNTQRSTASQVVNLSFPELRVSKKHAQYILSNADTKHLLDSKKLVLLVDLDLTLLHTTQDPTPDGIADVFSYKLMGLCFCTRLRPGTRDFLKNMSELYELHICTFGYGEYARKMAWLLDPDGSLFSKRILSRDEFVHPSSKSENMKYFFPRGDSMVCVIDDRGDVWNYAPNLVRVKPYNFFKENEEVDLQQLHRNDDDSHLLHLQAKLRIVHQTYYEMYENSKENFGVPDLKKVVPFVKKNVLESVYVVFSGVDLPPNVSIEESEIGKMAMSLGAVVQNKVVGRGDPNVKATTHVISTRLDTEKVHFAKVFKNVHLVSPDWLWCCAERWGKVDEKLFPLVEKCCVDQGRNEVLTRTNPVVSCTTEDIVKMDQKRKGNVVGKITDNKRGNIVRSKRKFVESLGDRNVNPCKKRHFNLPAVMPTFNRHL